MHSNNCLRTPLSNVVICQAGIDSGNTHLRCNGHCIAKSAFHVSWKVTGPVGFRARNDGILCNLWSANFVVTFFLSPTFAYTFHYY